MRTLLALLLASLFWVALDVNVALGDPQVAPKPAWSWYEVDARGQVKVNLYLFWSQSCSHCPPAVAFATDLQKRLPQVNVLMYEMSANPGNVALYHQIAAHLQKPVGPTPAFVYCKRLENGYVSYEFTGKRIEKELLRWHEWLTDYYKKNPPPPARPGSDQASARPATLATMLVLLQPGPDDPLSGNELPMPPEPAPEEEQVYVPGYGEVSAEDSSLPVLTLVLAGCDAFNPCAFFVLLLLLSLLVHGHSRMRMLAVGGTFVLFSGAMYYLFMAAWLNVFLLIGHLWAITMAGGVLALIAAGLNIKDYFWPGRGPSLSIPHSAKPHLFERMTRLIDVASWTSLLLGAAGLAILANLYELLCTSGFPMVYTRVLTLRQLPATDYYLYLLLYNLIYVAPLALIVFAFVMTLGSRKLTEQEGRILKLLSGMMMLVLGVALIAYPPILQSLGGAIGVLVASLGLTAAILLIRRSQEARTSESRSRRKLGVHTSNPRFELAGVAPERKESGGNG